MQADPAPQLLQAEERVPDTVRTASGPIAIALLATIAATLVGFFCFVKLYAGLSIMAWAWGHWLASLNQEHSKLVIPISAALVWYHRRKIAAAAKQPSNWGLLFLFGGFLLVLLGIRAVQPRITLLAIPFLTF